MNNEQIITTDDIQEQLELFRIVIDESPNIIILKDYDGKFLLANRALAELYGTNTKDIIGKSDIDFNPNIEQVEFYFKNIREIMDSFKTTVVYEQSTDAKSGKVHHYQSIKKPLRDNKGNLRILVIANDITDIVEAQEKVRISEDRLKELNANLEKIVQEKIAELREKDRLLIHKSKLESIKELLSNIAHHWRQPLATISTTVQLMEEAFLEDELSKEEMSNYSCMITKQLEFLSKTISDFHNSFSSNNANIKFSVKKCISELVSLVSLEFSKQNINIVLNGDDFHIVGKVADFNSAIYALLSNAKDTMLKNEISGDIYINLSKDENSGKITIKDCGGGIEPNIIDKIFEPY
ncbi:MAG: PAS domain-containing sensor histidine kinase, partial [Campylobacterales bacterium]|nr:PAS domain-containing sensor histidine kinase [Campylobacterales bacterium]